MQDFISTKEAAVRWQTSEACVRSRCADGTIPAVNRGGRWFLPADTPRPEEMPVLGEGAYTLPLAVGSVDFKYLSKEAYYVDKTLLLKEIIDRATGFFLITRPRRFGKTLNLDMIQTFFERTEEDNAAYFVDKKIWKCGLLYRINQGKYPVIILRLGPAVGCTWQETCKKLRSCLIAEVKRHRELAGSPVCGEEYRKLKKSFAAKGENAYNFVHMLRDLSRLLAAHYDTPAIILVDDYDAPLLWASQYGFYQEAANFLGSLLLKGLKDNNDVQYGILTGVLQVSMERVFDRLNNVQFFSVLSPQFSTCFGYTEEDVQEMAAAYHAEDKLEEIREAYKGYSFGGVQVYNPWVIGTYFEYACRGNARCEDLSSDAIPHVLIGLAGPDTQEKLRKLVRGETVQAVVDLQMGRPKIPNTTSAIFSYFVATGYLTAIDKPHPRNGRSCTLAIPNREVLAWFQRELDRWHI